MLVRGFRRAPRLRTAHEHGHEEDGDEAHAHEEHGQDENADEAHEHDEHEDAAHDDHALLGPPWPDDVRGVPAIIVKPKTIANAYQLRSEYRTETVIALGTQALAAAAARLVAMAHLAQRRRQIGALRAFAAALLAVAAVIAVAPAIWAYRQSPDAALRG